MDTVVNFINRFFDLLWIPLSKTAFTIDIIVVSAISAILFLLIFRATSNQKMITHYKGKIFAHILEIRLYRDQPILTLNSVINILKNNLIYLKYSLKPLVIIIIPFLIVTIQLNNRYGYMPITPGKSFIIRADVDKKDKSNDNIKSKDIRCEASDGLLLETEPLLIDSDGIIFWRARITEAVAAPIHCRIVWNDKKPVEKLIYTSNNDHRFSPAKTKWGWENLFVNNAESFINKNANINSIRVDYQRARYRFITWEIDPIIIYLILTLVFGFALKPFLKVDF